MIWRFRGKVEFEREIRIPSKSIRIRKVEYIEGKDRWTR